MQVVVSVFGNQTPVNGDTRDEEDEPSNTFPLNSPADNRINSDLKYNGTEINPLKVWKPPLCDWTVHNETYVFGLKYSWMLS